MCYSAPSTSDHGENLGEHGLMDHVFGLYDTTQRIPLVISYPGVFPKGESRGEPVQINDVFATLLRAGAIENVTDFIDMYDLFPDNWASIPADRPIFSEWSYPKLTLTFFTEEELNSPAIKKYKRSLQGLQIHGMKIIRASDGKHEMYDLQNDPAELTNLFIADPDAFRKLDNRLQDFINKLTQADKFDSTPAFTDEDLKRLRDLGYVK